MRFFYCAQDNCMYLVPRCPVHGRVLPARSLADYVRENTHAPDAR